MKQENRSIAVYSEILRCEAQEDRELKGSDLKKHVLYL